MRPALRLRGAALGVALGLACVAPARAVAQAQTTSYEELQRFSAVLNHIRMNYADSVTYATLVRAAIDGMLRSLDPHSWFAPTEDYERLGALDRGELAETGVVFEVADSIPTVLSVVPESPAAKAGVQPGDRLARIDGVPVSGWTGKSVALRLAGAKGSSVAVKFARGSRLEPDTFTVTLKRAFLKGHSVVATRMLDRETGYLRLGEFGDKSAQEIHDALGSLRSQKAKQVILDLRGNPGGLVTQAVDIASEFFPKGTLVFRTRGRRKDVDVDYVTKRDGDFLVLPLIVLIDRYSASAAEALTASLQDHDRALVLGRRSFGKALMQSGFIVPSGYVELTIGHVLTPSGRFIQRRYEGYSIEQYYAFAGNVSAGQDTMELFHTDHGREVRGGGGIAPDVALPGPTPPPAWWTVASDSGFDDLVSDSVALTLGTDAAARAAWASSPDSWRRQLLPPFLDRVRSRLHVAAQPDSATATFIARRLAYRAAKVRWPPAGGEEFALATDSDVRAAVTYFPRLGELLRGGAATK